MKILHTADWHADSETKKAAKLEAALEQMLDYVRKHKVDAIIHAGDIWERKQPYAKRSGVPLSIKYLREMSKHVGYIFITKGNNSHDEPGSVFLLHQLEPNIYAYEIPVTLGVNSMKVEDIAEEPTQDYDYIVSLIPYPTKASFISEGSIDNNNADFIEKFEGIFDLIGDITQPYACPKLLAFHGNVVGSRLSTGQTLLSQDIMVAPATLKKAKADYYALGHIHLRQEVQPGMVYAGSIYNKNWGETEQKSFEVIEFKDERTSAYETDTIKLTASRPMITVEAVFNPNVNANFIYHTTFLLEELEKAEIRFRCAVKENDRKLLTDEVIGQIKAEFGDDVKIEWTIIPDARESRSESIMYARTLLEEVEEYAKVVEFELPKSIKEKVQKIEEA